MSEMRLTREVRFSLSADEPELPVANSWGGWPASGGLAPFVVLRVCVTGEVDQRTGYLCNISLIDRAVRERVIPRLREQWVAGPARVPWGDVLREIGSVLGGALPNGVAVAGVELRPTPFLRFAIRSGDPKMVCVTQSFEFAAAHRLHCAELSDEENRRVFGKCTNPNGHGHNYVLEVTVGGEPDAQTGMVIEIGRLERVVKERVIDVFDHKHLNADCAEFSKLNPSVENITRVIWDRLEGAFAPAELTAVRVYETPKTHAELRRG